MPGGDGSGGEDSESVEHVLDAKTTGVITGTPTAGGAFSVTAKATEANGAHGASTFAFQIYG